MSSPKGNHEWFETRKSQKPYHFIKCNFNPIFSTIEIAKLHRIHRKN